MERRLAAILIAEVVGRLRPTEADAAGRLARLDSLRRKTIDPAVARHAGHIMDPRGDASSDIFGALFPNAAEAVLCAVEVQREIAGDETDEPAERKIQYRIGVNVGDFVFGGDGFSDGGVSSIAARLSGFAKPGGVCISGLVYEIGMLGLDLQFEDGGEVTVLKPADNVSLPVHVWHWSNP